MPANGTPTGIAQEAVNLSAVRAAIVARNFGEAAELAQNLVASYPADPDAHFELARAQALAGNEGLALDALQKAVELGLADTDRKLSDPAFSEINGTEHFVGIVDMAYMAAHPRVANAPEPRPRARVESGDVSITDMGGSGTHIQAGDVVLDTDF